MERTQMMTALQFAYSNHRNENHVYKVLPIEVGWFRCKCFPSDPEKESWGIRALCLERDGELRNVIRTFAVVKMIGVIEIPLGRFE
jgi:hypothetical protein